MSQCILTTMDLVFHSTQPNCGRRGDHHVEDKPDVKHLLKDINEWWEPVRVGSLCSAAAHHFQAVSMPNGISANSCLMPS